MSQVVLVTGTGGTKQKNEWHMKGRFIDDLHIQGLSRLDEDTPFYWSSNLDGIFGDNYDWIAAGHALRDYIFARTTDIRRRNYPINIICHSHGLAPVVYAAFFGVRFGTVVSLGSPYRDKMKAVYFLLANRCRVWHHIHSNWRDPWAFLGGLRPGKPWGTTRRNDQAINHEFKGVSHGGLVDMKYLIASHAIEDLVRIN